MAPTGKPKRLLRRRPVQAALALGLGLAVALLLAEGIAQVIEPRTRVSWSGYVADPELGFVPPPGPATHEASEFTVHYDINELGMNDAPIGDSVERSRHRIMVLGDSHTFAFGVSRHEAWPHVLEQELFASESDGTVYNLGVIGYSLGQYLLRMERTIDRLDPQLVLVGFSMATDLWDLIPPRKGGFVYGSQFGRTYFDLGPEGQLQVLHDLEGRTIESADATFNPSLRLRRAFEHSALYRRFRRSKLALWVAVRVRPGGSSLWPGMDTALKRELTEEDRYRWELAERILERIAALAAERGAQVALVNIPYIAQVYDDVWESSFGARSGDYDRWIAGRRLAALCRRLGVRYIDTTPHLVAEASRRARRLHYPVDGHPTAAGHAAIARAVARALDAAGLDGRTEDETTAAARSDDW